MKTRLLIIVIFLILIGFTSPVFAQEYDLSDLNYEPAPGHYGRHFDYGDIVKVSGHFYSGADSDIIIHLIWPSGEKKYLERSVITDGNFHFSFPISDDFEIGKYLFVIEVADTEIGTATPFYVARENQFDFTFEEQDYAIHLESIRFEISNAVFDKDSKSISFDVKRIPGNYSADDYLQFDNTFGIQIQRPLISPPYSLIINDEQYGIDDYEIDLIDGYYSMKVNLGDMEGKVSIVGTYVVPEFETITVMILAVSILPLIIIQRFRN